MSETPDGAVKLQPGDYWRFRARLLETDAVIRQAQALRLAEYQTLVQRYGLPATATTFRWNDDTCELVATEAANG